MIFLEGIVPALSVGWSQLDMMGPIGAWAVVQRCGAHDSTNHPTKH